MFTDKLVGRVYTATDVITRCEVAVKLEQCNFLVNQLENEEEIYQELSCCGCTVGFPIVQWFGQEGDFNVMVMDLLGPSLETLFNICGRRFSVNTTLLIASQAVCVASSIPVIIADFVLSWTG